MNKCLLILLLLLMSSTAIAHTPSESFSTWRWSDGVLSMQFTISEREATRLVEGRQSSSLAEAFSSYVTDTTQPDTQSCDLPGDGRPLRAREGWLRMEVQWTCSEPPRSLVVRSFFDLAAEHTHYVTYVVNEEIRQKILTGDRGVWELTEAGESPSLVNRFVTFFNGGLRHVSSGIDHLVFLFALVVGFQRKRDIVLAVSGFTLGHFLAIAAISFDVVVVNQKAVESLIGLTVCLVCVEYFSRRAQPFSYLLLLAVMGLFAILRLFLPSELSAWLLFGLSLMAAGYLGLERISTEGRSMRIMLTLFFGLIHGAGFASGFIASDVLGHSLWSAVIGFNLGVEVGQLIFVGLVLGVLWQLTPRSRELVQDVALTVFFGVGVYWFFVRGFSDVFQPL